MNIIDPEEATDSLRDAVNSNIRESAKRQHLINKGYLDPRDLEKADEAAHPERGEAWEEQRSYRERLQAGPLTVDEVADFFEQADAKFAHAATLIEDLQKRVAELEKVSVSIPTVEELQDKPKRGNAKKTVVEV